jgi:hypothetical protein
MGKPSTEKQIRQMAQWPTEKFLLFLSRSACLNYFEPAVASMIATRLQEMAAAKRKRSGANRAVNVPTAPIFPGDSE